jgi:hypothetical protein
MPDDLCLWLTFNHWYRGAYQLKNQVNTLMACSLVWPILVPRDIFANDINNLLACR